MPMTPYHLGPNAFFGLLFRRWIDLPVFVVAGLIVDFEVLVIEYYYRGQSVPRYGHTLVVAAAEGVVLAILMFPLKGPCLRILGKLGLPYRTGIVKMVASGILGACFHVLIDGLYRRGVGIFWPLKIDNPLCRHGRSDVETLCSVLSIAAFMLFALIVALRSRTKHAARRIDADGD